MTGFSGSPNLVKGGIVLVDPVTAAVVRVVALQYNPDTLNRTLQVQAVGGEEADRSEALRLKGPPRETIKLEAEIDATDQLEFPVQNRVTAQLGIYPQLAALETTVYPTSAQLHANDGLARIGTLEVAAMEAPLALFVWSKVRVLPVRITEFSVTEQAFDPALNPIQAKVSLGLRVLSVEDLGFRHKGGALFMAHLQDKERLASQSASAPFSALGIAGIP